MIFIMMMTVFPAKSNCITVRDEDRSKKLNLVAKRLILANLKEIYAHYKDQNHTAIGLSTFASLRPKNCVFAGSNGTHSVCSQFEKI